MDDIYFAVLRLWGTLTSHKGIFVALVGIVAVVATVTTVVADPLTGTDNPAENVEEAPDVFVRMDRAETVEPIVLSGSVLDPREELSIGGVDSPGILPTSPFYFAKGIGREMRYAFTFDHVERANLKLRYANEDALAIRTMLIEGEYLSAAQQCHSYQENFFESLTWAVALKKQGHDVDDLMQNLMTAHHGHRLVLADGLQVVEEAWCEAFMGAVTFTSTPFEQVIDWMYGEDEATAFYTKLRNDFSSVDTDLWLQIENRLGLDVEQAAALHEAMGEDGKEGQAPVITSVRADSFEIEPGATVTIRCAASDLAGGALTFEWRTSHGSLENGDQPTVQWTAPDELGLYTVTVTVTDERGNDSRKSVNLRVGSPEPDPVAGRDGPFRIEEITAERAPDIGRSNISPLAIGQDWRTAERSVYVHSPIRITCNIDGATDGLTYEWSADLGTIEGDGDTVIWTAPGHASKARVSVVVQNGAGTSEEATLNFRISTCAPCFQW